VLVVRVLTVALMRLVVHATFIEWSAKALLTVRGVLIHVGRVVRAVVVWMSTVRISAMLILTVGLLMRVLPSSGLAAMLLAAWSWIGRGMAALRVLTIPRCVLS